MPVFQYKAYDTAGSEVSGELEARTSSDAAAKLKGEGLYPRQITAGKQAAAVRLRRDRGGGGVSLTELAATTRQLSTLLNSGAALHDSLSIIINECEDKALGERLVRIKDRIAEGSSLANALEEHPGVFNEMYTRMVEAGEAGGMLPKVLERIAEFIESKARVLEHVKTALIYPIIMTVVGTGVLGFLLLFVVPKITRIFEDTNAALPLVTVILLALVGFLTSYWPFLLAGGGLGVWALKAYTATPVGKGVKDRWLLTLPRLGKLLIRFYSATFSRTLGSLLDSGVPMLKSIDMTKKALDHARYSETLEKAEKDVTEGVSLSKSLAGSKIVPSMLVHMIAIGENSGKLPEMLNKAADTYEREFEASVTRTLALLEPLLILAMGVAVGFIIVSILLPIIELNRIIG
jgi:general secretion pathway protein F